MAKKDPTDYRFQIYDWGFQRNVPLYGTDTLEEAYEASEDIDFGEIREIAPSTKRWKIFDGCVKRKK